MAISQYPGVGPTNTDVASAVVTAGTAAGFAATGPTTTQIAAAVPTLAQITTAITSNAASAGVTMAAITSSITANAASAGVTLAAIGTQVANNSSSPLNWTLLATGSLQNVNAATVSFSSYRALRIIVRCQVGSGSTQVPAMRLNGDTSGAYSAGRGALNGSNTNSQTGNPQIQLSGTGNNSSPINAIIEISNANTTAVKGVSWQITMLDSSTGQGVNYIGVGSYTGGSAITSFTLFDLNGANWAASANNATAFQVFGAN